MSVTIYEVGPRDGLQNEAALVPTEVKAEFVRRLLAAGLPVVEATSFVHPRWVPQLADAEELMTRARRPGPGPPRPGAQRARSGPGARARAAARRDLRQRHRDLRPEEPQPLPRGAVRDVRAHGGAGPGRPASTCAPTSRCASATRGRGRPDRAGGLRGHPAARPRREPAEHRRHHRRRHRAARQGPGRGLRRRRGRHRPAGDALPRHLRPGARQRVRRPPGGHHHLRRQRGRSRRLPLRRERHRQPGHRGPGVDADRAGHRARRRPRRPGRDQRLDGRGTWAGRARRRWCVPSPPRAAQSGA